MSFLIDPPLLFLSGIAIYVAGLRMGWNRHAKIVVGIGVVLTFVVFSALLYLDLIRCVFPFFSGLTGSEFMLHTNLTGITRDDVPGAVVVALFILYPVWLFCGYAASLLASKQLRRSREVFTYADVRSRCQRETSRVSVSRSPDPHRCVREAVAALGGMSTVVRPGDRVLVKVNICGGVPEDPGTFTSVAVADEVVNLVRKAGGDPVVADADMIWTKFWPAAQDEGYVRWAEQKGVKLVNLSETESVGFNFGRESALGTERVSREVLDADVIISVSAMKTHLLTGVTLGMKNMYGTFPEIDKARYHRKKIEDVIFEVNLAFLPNLTIIDGTIGGEAIGPLSCRQVDFQTVVASNDVVAADAAACQLMGYDPMYIDHIAIAHQRGLGNASLRYDLNRLPYAHAGGKDGNWDRPDLEVKSFYEWAIEQLLRLPGWETLFNIGADFFLYDLARLPVFKYLTPAGLQLLNDIFILSLEDQEDTDEDRSRRRSNLLIISTFALASLVGFYADGYIWKAGIGFDLGYIMAIALSVWSALRMRTDRLATLTFFSAALGAVVEYLLLRSGLVAYYGPSIPPLFAVAGWAVLMTSIFGLADLLRAWISGIGIFSQVQGWRWRIVPLLAVLAAFVLFMVWEGYFCIAGPVVLLMYASLALLGLFASSKSPVEWNASLAVVSIVIGGLMEFAGSASGLWWYSFQEPLSVFICLAWAVNSAAVNGLTTLSGMDVSSNELS
ncbi:MAG TPA: DUF362 domain-containing protein [Methanotrichaceae archaeon]|nr:DUF362 domain-containing protein [Methanotrichaceae archaeon]